MTTPYTPRSTINELHDMIDKHVPAREAALQEHYQKAAETRVLLTLFIYFLADGPNLLDILNNY